MNIKDLIAAAHDLPLKKVNVPEWDVDLHLRTLSNGERVSLMKECAGKKDDYVVPRFLVEVIADEDGNKVLSKDDMPLLNKKSTAVLRRVFDEAISHNGMGSEAVEEEEKN